MKSFPDQPQTAQFQETLFKLLTILLKASIFWADSTFYFIFIYLIHYLQSNKIE